MWADVVRTDNHRVRGDMNFEFSEDQNMLREQAQRFLRDKCDSRKVRDVLEGDAAFDAGLWNAIVEMGWTATTIPEAYGGLGLGHLELCVIAEELGRVLAPTAHALVTCSAP